MSPAGGDQRPQHREPLLGAASQTLMRHRTDVSNRCRRKTTEESGAPRRPRGQRADSKHGVATPSNHGARPPFQMPGPPQGTKPTQHLTKFSSRVCSSGGPSEARDSGGQPGGQASAEGTDLQGPSVALTVRARLCSCERANEQNTETHTAAMQGPKRGPEQQPRVENRAPAPKVCPLAGLACIRPASDRA